MLHYYQHSHLYHENNNSIATIRILDNCIYGKVKLLYLSPERLFSELVVERIKKMKHGTCFCENLNGSVYNVGIKIDTINGEKNDFASSEDLIKLHQILESIYRQNRCS